MIHGSTGASLLSQVLKLLEGVLDAGTMRRVEGDFGEEQQGFRKGRGTNRNQKSGNVYLSQNTPITVYKNS